jgi:hypothetical protein
VNALDRWKPYGQYGRDVVLRHLAARMLPTRSTTLPWNRYLTLTLATLARQEAGLSVRFAPRHIIGPATYANYMDQYARLAFRLEGVEFESRLPADSRDRVLVYDSEDCEAAKLPWRRRIRLRYDVSARRDDVVDWMVAPYPMHPLRYFSGDIERLDTLRQSKRTMRVLLAGNMDAQVYASPQMTTLCSRFGYLNRAEWHARVLQSGLPLQKFAAERQQVGEASIVLATSSNNRIPAAQWLDVLAGADFFISPPGVFMPTCHNTIEAMAVGTIPILMHHDWFHPPLVDGEQCLVLRGAEDLPALLRRALLMPDSAIAAMRNGVVEYYERHLRPEAFMRHVMSNTAPTLAVFFNHELPAEMVKITRDSVLVAGPPPKGSEPPRLLVQ